jgi:hypothetical protein
MTKTKIEVDLHTLTHQGLLDLIADPRRTIALRREAIQLLQDRGHRPLGISNVPDREIEIILETVAPQREKPARWWMKVPEFDLWK